MNRETESIVNYIEDNPETKEKLDAIIQKYTNSRDFKNQIGYLIMDIVSKNEQFYKLNRNKLELNEISERYFG